MADAPQVPTAPQEESAKMAFVSNALAIVGFIILFVIIVWGLFHIINLSGSSIGSFFSTSPKMSVTAPKTAAPGKPISISWKYSGNDTGTYSFLYQCESGFAFATGVAGGLANIPCGSAIAVGSSTSATIVPVFTKKPTASASVPVTVVFVTAAGARTEGSATIDVSAAGSSTQVPMEPIKTTTTALTSHPTTTTHTHTARKAVHLVPHASSGPADLSVKMILVGVIDPSSGALIPRAPISPAEIVGVEFDIANVGGSSTGTWYFSAQLPTGLGQPYQYNSPAQISLKPGEHIVSVLRFQPNMRPGMITVTADPASAVYDANRGNNTISQQI